MTNKFLLALIALLTVLLLAGCGAKPEIVYVSGEESEKVAATVEPIAKNTLAGIETNNYDLFASNFDEAMRKAITTDAFSNIVEQFGKNGAHQSIELLNIEDQVIHYGVNFSVNYAEAKTIMRVIVSKDTPNLVSGLWFK